MATGHSIPNSIVDPPQSETSGSYVSKFYKIHNPLGGRIGPMGTGHLILLFVVLSFIANAGCLTGTNIVKVSR